MLSPISLSNDFSGIVLSHLNEASSSLCCNFIVIILVWSSYECQIGFNKTFLYKESFADSEIETFRKARDPTNEKKSIFVSEILKSRLQLVLPTVFKEMLTTPHGKDNLKLTQTKVRMLLFFASVCLAWRVCECQFASWFMLTQTCFTFSVSTQNSLRAVSCMFHFLISVFSS